jgi:predicted transcriptional regulator
MGDEPTDTEPPHDEFTPGPDEVEYSSTLRITALPAAQAKAAAIESADRWEGGKAVPHVVNVQDRARLRELLTGRRTEPLEAVMAHPPESIRALFDRLDHDVHEVHDDLHLLAEYEVIHFEADGRAKQPYVPYETVRIEVEFGQEEPPTTEPESPGDWPSRWTSSSRRRSPLARLAADEFDLQMEPLVWEVRPPRLPVFDDAIGHPGGKTGHDIVGHRGC